MINRKEIFNKSLEFSLFSSLIILFLFSAIDSKTFQLLLSRSKGKCESNLRNKNGGEKPERCGCQKSLEVAHNQHGDNKRLNGLDNIKHYCIRCHYLDHFYRRRNKLPKEANNWTLNSIWNRMSLEEKSGLPTPPASKKNNVCRK